MEEFKRLSEVLSPAQDGALSSKSIAPVASSFPLALMTIIEHSAEMQFIETVPARRSELLRHGKKLHQLRGARAMISWMRMGSTGLIR